MSNRVRAVLTRVVGEGAERKARLFGLARSLLFLVAAYYAGKYFLQKVDPHYPAKEWLFFVYAKLWAYCLLFAGGCFAAGQLAMRALRVPALPLRERLVLTSALGVFTFFFATFVGGLLGILRGWFAVALPLVFMAAAAPSLYRDGRRVLRKVRARRARGVSPRPWSQTPVMLFGAFGVALVYYAILTPKNLAFDAHFYHMGIAQQYATEHAIRPFGEGWMPAALPHLASVLYAWAFCLPKLEMFERIVCAAHVEFVTFAFTLASIPTLVRYLAPRAPAAASWAAMFLFPGILVYDSGLSGAADHIAAFWAVPAWLAFRRAYRGLEPRASILLAACLSGAILTKYQAMYILAFPVAALIGRAGWLLGAAAWRRFKRREPVSRSVWLAPVIGLGCAALAGLVLTSPHWAKNWAFYGDPLFPYLNKYFPSARWVPDTAALFKDWSESQTKNWVTQGDTKTKLKEALTATFTFSFQPHDWPNFHGKVPVFGSLFTLSLAGLPFLKGTKRTWALSAATHLGVFVWFYTMHQDRYLQILVPWMAAVVASTIALAWRTGWLARAGVVGLVGLQIVWGGDAYLIPSHAMTKSAPITTTNELLSMGYKKRYEQRFKLTGALFELGASKELPKDARVLLHENNPRLGLWRPVLSDIAGWQFALRYELFATPGALDDKLRALGVTHVVSRAKKSRGIDCLGADLRFFDYLEHDAKVLKRSGDMTLYAMPAARPADQTADSVAYLGCGKVYDRGLYKLGDLSVRDKQKVVKPRKKRARKRGEPEELLGDADFAVVDPKCKPAVSAELLKDFVKVGTRAKEDLYARRRGEGAPVDKRNGKPDPDPSDDGPSSPEDEDRLLE